MLRFEKMQKGSLLCGETYSDFVHEHQCKKKETEFKNSYLHSNHVYKTPFALIITYGDFLYMYSEAT